MTEENKTASDSQDQAGFAAIQKDATDELRQELGEAIRQAEENLHGWKRAQADFENFKKRKDAENRELVDFAKEVTVAKMLPTLDTLDQALRHIPKKPENPGTAGEEFFKQFDNWLVGMQGILAQLGKVFEEMGISKIEAVGKKFDPHYHEAVREVEGEDDQMVVEELQSGFTLNGKVIRPSQVAISKKRSGQPSG